MNIIARIEKFLMANCQDELSVDDWVELDLAELTALALSFRKAKARELESDLATARTELRRYQAEREQLLARIEELVAELRECMNANTLTAEDSDNPYILHGEELDRAEHARIAGRS